MLIFTASSPIGHHIHLCSMVPCVFGEEDTVMPNLDKVHVTITTCAILLQVIDHSLLQTDLIFLLNFEFVGYARKFS